QEQTAMDVNLAAAKEIARQLRLRDLGGIVIIDFIDLHKAQNKQALYDEMVKLMETDKAKHTVLPLTKFGLMQITRQRVRPVAVESVSDVCPTCNGTGKIEPTVLLDKKIENQISFLTHGFNVVNVNSTELVVFEAAIDLMSYVDIFTDYESNKLALGMLADAPLETFLREHPQITSIRFCLDRDEPGRKAAAELMRKYYELGYEVEDCPPPAGYKDYNEWLVAAKLNLNRMNKRADEPVRA
ncbi:ribonuclease, Rne/Rng family, partial [human gut metagenome]